MSGVSGVLVVCVGWLVVVVVGVVVVVAITVKRTVGAVDAEIYRDVTKTVCKKLNLHIFLCV